MTNAAIAVNNLAFKYGGLKVIDGMTLEIESGTSYGLLGPNGAGKTTLIRLMVGLLKPAGGSVLCLGQAPTRAIAKNIGYMPQLPALYSELSVEQNIDFFGRIYGLRNRKERAKRVNDVIKVVNLWDKRKTQIMKLSGGMKQRVSLACAIVHQPPLIFLDEPTVGLDPELRVHFWEYFTDLTKAGHTLIISSHTFDDAAHCQRLAFLRLGRVAAQGSPAELRAATGNRDASLEDAFLYFIRQDEVKKNVQ
ncbi:MAG: ABC transporter ATP-binding protein [Chloroflexi bacterium RBG_16_50_11]|nr:MAG: ABC transporter ATP-binding protein [Chloroflexi bacterium RBG_16_50_11]